MSEFIISNLLFNTTINLNHNPINCDCQIINFLSYIKKQTNQNTTSNRFHIESSEVICAGPSIYEGIKIKDIEINNFLCQNDTAVSDPQNFCNICDCWMKPFDNTLILNCSQRNIGNFLEKINVTEITKIELNLQATNLYEIPNLQKIEYGKNISLINLSNNFISTVDEKLLTQNLQVTMNNIEHIR